jgi:hypothetical protein
LDRLHIRVHLWWVSRWIRQLLVVTGARCPLTKPVVTAVELQAATEPHCSRGVQPGGICVYAGTARAGSRRSGVGLAPRPQALHMPAAVLILYMLPAGPDKKNPASPCKPVCDRSASAHRHRISFLLVKPHHLASCIKARVLWCIALTVLLLAQLRDTYPTTSKKVACTCLLQERWPGGRS